MISRAGLGIWTAILIDWGTSIVVESESELWMKGTHSIPRVRMIVIGIGIAIGQGNGPVIVICELRIIPIIPVRC